MALSAFDTKVCDALIGLVEDDGANYSRYFKTYGEDLYPAFREMLVFSGKRLVGETKPTKKAKEGKKTTKEQIIFDNTMSKMKEKMSRVIIILEKMYSEMSTCVSDYIMTNEVVDIRSVGFMYLSWFIFENTVDTTVAFGVIVSLQRYLKAVSSLTFTHIVTGIDSCLSKSLIDDLELYIKRNISKYNFRGDTLYQVEPTLIIESPWDKYIPKPPVKPFTHQKLLSDIILSIGREFSHESVKTASSKTLTAAYVEVRVLTSAGKTTSIVNVAAAVKKRQRVFPDIKIYAVCAIEPIRRRWATLLGYSKISYFAYDDLEAGESPSIKKNTVVVICSPEQSLEHLSTNSNSILFYDEPTLYSDGTNALKLLSGVAVLKLMPRFTFLCSATLDIPNKELYNDHKKRFPDSVFIDVFSPEIYGYSNVQTLDGIIVSPHMCCKSRDELEYTIKRLETVPLLGKFYNPTVVKQLFDVAKKHTSAIPNVDQIFGDVENLSPDAVRKVAYSLLKVIVNLEDSQITDICKLVKSGEVVKFETLGTSDAHKYQHVNLIATANPSDFAETYFRKLADDIKSDIGSYDQLRAPYEAWLEHREELKKRIKTDEELARALEEHDLSRPKCYVPEKFQINTFEHIRKYGKTTSKGRCRVPILEILECGHVSETVDLLTQVGVGVYKQTAFPKGYTNLLMGSKKEQGLVTEGRLEFVVADTDIAYGIDCPFGGLFVDKSLCELISLNTLFQLISRVGRGRKSPYANIFIDRLALTNIMEMVRDDEYENEETETLITVYNKISCFFYVKTKAVVIINIPFDGDHTRFEIKNGSFLLYKGDEVVWTGPTKCTYQLSFDIKDGNLNSAGKNMGKILNM